MPNTTSFRVASPFLAVALTEKQGFHTVPEGASIEAPDELHEPGYVQIRLNEKMFLAFARDVQERTERVEPVPE